MFGRCSVRSTTRTWTATKTRYGLLHSAVQETVPPAWTHAAGTGECWDEVAPHLWCACSQQGLWGGRECSEKRKQGPQGKRTVAQTDVALDGALYLYLNEPPLTTLTADTVWLGQGRCHHQAAFPNPYMTLRSAKVMGSSYRLTRGSVAVMLGQGFYLECSRGLFWDCSGGSAFMGQGLFWVTFVWGLAIMPCVYVLFSLVAETPVNKEFPSHLH